MLRGILPKEYAFYDFFEKLASLNVQISREFMTLIEGKRDFDNGSLEIKRLKREADRISRSCTDLLHRTFITPIDRDDIYYLVKGLNDFSDDIHTVTFRLTNYGISEIRVEAVEFAKVIQECTQELEVSLHGLRKIKQSDIIREKCEKIHELEDQSDDIHRNAISNLFKQNDLFLLIKWKEIFERLEKAVDRLERVARTIESILIDNS